MAERFVVREIEGPVIVTNHPDLTRSKGEGLVSFHVLDTAYNHECVWSASNNKGTAMLRARAHGIADQLNAKYAVA